LDVAASIVGSIIGYVISGIDGIAYGLFIGFLSSMILDLVYFIFFAPYSSDDGNPGTCAR